jgi:hypothetical protein
MQLRQCERSDCYTLRKGVTPEEFFGQRWKSPSGDKYQLDNDVWEVFVFPMSTSEPAVITAPDDPYTGGPVSMTASHQEFVAFKNGHMEDWGWGMLPRVLKQNRKRLTVLKS